MIAAIRATKSTRSGYGICMSDANLRGERGFAPIGSYGILGDGRTVALVAMDGSIDWMALPVLDSSPVFDRILDGTGGGRFELCPDVDYSVQRRYRDHSAVLETTFHTAQGTVTVVDALNRLGDHPLPWVELARVIEAADGEVPMRWRLAPGRRFGTAEAWAHRVGERVSVQLGDQTMALVRGDVGDAEVRTHEVAGRFVAKPGKRSLLALVATDSEPVPPVEPEEVIDRVQETTDRWRAWCRQITYDGPWRDAVERSVLTLKLLTVAANGANVAAATTSLPEVVGGDRNFDYRFCWVRDASFALDALTGLGISADVHATLSWLLRAVARTAPDVHVFYTVGGEPAPGTMTEVPALAGYLGTSPVHVGNSAATQRQLGAYGHVMDAAWRFVREGGLLDPATATMFEELADKVCDLWWKADAGIWELGQYEQYTSSKVGCWVALDRAVWFSEHGHLASRHVPRWRAVRDEIRDWVDAHCWSETKRAYTMHDHTDDLDAAVLLMARTGFARPDDPRFSSTVEAVEKELRATGPLLFRYTEMKGKEGAFAACSFWLVEALVHCGRRDDARAQLDAMLEYCNDLGLLSEEVDPSSGDLLGNFPQGLSHLALIGAACALRES